MIPDDPTLMALALALGQQLRSQGRRLVTVESCTGGYVAKLLTDVAGSSQWFDCGYVTYSNTAKQRDVGVHPQTLLREGAVSDAVVREMAEGAIARTHADIAISLSGVAGPDGGTPRHPVGSVWFGKAQREGDAVSCFVQHRQFAGDRDAVRRQSAAVALRWLLSN